jgi:hypothetical protein
MFLPHAQLNQRRHTQEPGGSVVTPMADTEPAPSVKEPCVAVIAMSRSGSSATAGLLIKLGLSGPQPDDLISASSSNELGHWESKAVHRCNGQLFRAVGCTTFTPPPVIREWNAVPNFSEVREHALKWFSDTYSGGPVMVKDPRMCITLPFWRDVLPAPMAAVFVLRDPVKVSRSLQARDDIPVSLGLAQWDRYLRSAAAGLEGLPTLVIEYDRMMAEPVASTDEICDFLGHLGIKVSDQVKAQSIDQLDVRLRHQQADHDDYDDMAQVQRQIYSALAERRGPHSSWTSPEFPPPPEWVDDVLRLRRAYAARNRELLWVKDKAEYRIGAAVRRLAGRPRFADLLDVTTEGRPVPTG